MDSASKNPKVLGTLFVVFLAGAVVGALSMQLGLHEKLHKTVAAASVAPVRKAPPNDALVNRFRNELNLTPDQTDKLATVLEDYREYYHSLQDQLDDVRSTGKERIMQILNQDQRDKFQKIMGELQPQLEAK